MCKRNTPFKITLGFQIPAWSISVEGKKAYLFPESDLIIVQSLTDQIYILFTHKKSPSPVVVQHRQSSVNGIHHDIIIPFFFIQAMHDIKLFMESLLGHRLDHGRHQ